MLFGLHGAAQAGTIVEVGYWAQSPTTCATSLSSGESSATLSIDYCQGSAGTILQGSYVSASAQALSVSLNGYFLSLGTQEVQLPGLVEITGSSEVDGAFLALGGSGSAFLEFDIWSGGADDFSGRFLVPQAGIGDIVTGFGYQKHYTIPITFGNPLSYSLQVQNQLWNWRPDLIAAGLRIYNPQVVDANGTAIPGASVTEIVPEPALWMPAAVALAAAALVVRRRKARA